MAYSSGWTAQHRPGKPTAGRPTIQRSTTGNTATITVPADFPGGEIDLLTLAYGGGTEWSTVVDSGGAQVLDGTGSAYGSNCSRGNLVVQRLTGLAAGTHTIVVTISAIDAGATAIFGGWMVTAPELPLTVLCTSR